MRLRQLYLWHRYVGIALCLLFALWFVSGVAMMYVRMPILFPADRFGYLQPFDPARIKLTPVEAAEKAGLTEPPRRMRLVALLELAAAWIDGAVEPLLAAGVTQLARDQQIR